VNQAWTLPPVGTKGEVRILGLCLDDDGGAWAEGDVVHLWSCWGGPGQRWTLTSEGQLRGENDKCVTPVDGGTANGTRLVLATCSTPRPEQRWTVR
jgi:hypothetical protein